MIVFLGLGRERLLPLARYTHRSLLQAPAYLAHTFTVSLSLLDTSRVPSHYCLQSSWITKSPKSTVPFDSSNSGVVRLLLSTSYISLPPAVPSPGCLSFPSLATTSLRDTFFESSVIMRRTSTSLLFASLVPIFLLRPRASSLQRYATSAGRTHRDLDRTSKSTRSLLEVHDHTSPLKQTCHHDTRRERGAWSGRLERNNFNIRATAPPCTLKNDFES